MQAKVKLNPSEKIKKRYLLMDTKDKDLIKKIILDYIGILGWAKAKPSFIKKDEEIILIIDRGAVDDIKAAFEISKEKVKVLRVSGTLDGLEK